MKKFYQIPAVIICVSSCIFQQIKAQNLLTYSDTQIINTALKTNPGANCNLNSFNFYASNKLEFSSSLFGVNENVVDYSDYKSDETEKLSNFDNVEYNFILETEFNNHPIKKLQDLNDLEYSGNAGSYKSSVQYLNLNADIIDNKFVTIKMINVESFAHSHYELERSFDGISFKTSAILLDGFDEGIEKIYAYKDKSCELADNKNIYYRLKQFNKDGHSFYTKIFVINMTNHQANLLDISANLVQNSPK